MLSNTTKCLFSSVLLAALSSGSVFAGDAAPGEPENPLELRKIMQDMGRAMQEITGAISREDWKKVAETAPLIADHPKPPLSEKIRILAFAGTDVGRFKDFDRVTHDTARQLAQTAAGGDGHAVIREFATLQASCLDCHRAFRKPLQAYFYGDDWLNRQ